MHEVRVRAQVTDAWDSSYKHPQMIITWEDEKGQTWGTRVVLQEGVPRPWHEYPKWIRDHPELTQEDRDWLLKPIEEHF
jgi:phenolic acid decarboxylase